MIRGRVRGLDTWILVDTPLTMCSRILDTVDTTVHAIPLYTQSQHPHGIRNTGYRFSIHAMVGATSWVLPADTPFGSCFLGDRSAVGAMGARADAPRVGVTGLSVVLVLDADWLSPRASSFSGGSVPLLGAVGCCITRMDAIVIDQDLDFDNHSGHG